MDKEAEEGYNQRQNEPLLKPGSGLNFKSAKDMIPMEQVREHYENLLCGYHRSRGCQVLKRDKSYYACIWHQAMQAIGTDFFWYYKLLTDNDLSRMSTEQFKQLEERRVYQQKWMDNYPRGA